MPVGARRESGAVLITALLILVILTVLGISATGDSTLEERMAGNYRDQMSAREAAEMGIRSAEDWLRSNIYNAAQLDYTASPSSLTSLYLPTTTAFLFSPADPAPSGLTLSGVTSLAMPPDLDLRNADNWEPVNESDYDFNYANAVSGSTLASLGLIRSPRYVIEYVGRGATTGQNLVQDAEGQAFTIVRLGFRITSVGWGRQIEVNDAGNERPITAQVLQSHFEIPL
ncbi:MAG: hypothetical protein KDG50_09345 [Chromatiales bacterium]|nr:hypothetical protein [Chromatiales bacterium]